MRGVATGNVCYLELVSEDPAATRDLLEAVHGWRFGPAAPELGGAFVARLPDGSWCGVRPSLHPEEKPITRTYVRVDNLDLAVARATKARAKLALSSMDLPPHGRIAIWIGQGIEQGAWELPADSR